MWIKTTNAGAAYMYQGDGGWGSGNTSFYLNPGSAANGTKGGGVRHSQGWQTGTATLNDGAWHFIAMTCNNGTKAFYVNGVVDAWAANAWSGNSTGGQLWIGGTADTGDGNAPFNGTIDEVFVYGRTLSQVEVTNLMNRVTGLVLNGVNQSPGVYSAATSAPYLAGTGSLLIGIPVATNPTNISYSIGGGNLTLTWLADHIGWRLEAQTNSLTTGLSTNWITVADSTATNQVAIPPNHTNGSVFFRLVYP